MYISIPKEFFVPVLFSEDFRLNFETNSMEYDTEKCENDNSSSRSKLLDIDFIEYRGEGKPIVIEEVISKGDNLIQDQILDYIKGFMLFINQLKTANCLGKDEEGATIRLINYYANQIKEIYNEYRNLIKTIKTPLHESDVNGIIEEYIGKIEDIYNNTLKSINCKNLNYDAIEAVIVDIINDARNILREQIYDINCNLINEKKQSKNYKNIEEKFKENENMYNMLDNEFLQEIKK